jgi:SAM-dependent methyltransferase
VDDSLETLSTDLRNSLEPSIRVFFSREFVICSLHFERFTTEAAGRDLERLGLLRAFEKPTTAREALARAGHVHRAETPLEWMLSKLAEEGFLESFRESSPARYRLRDPHPPADSGAKEKALAIAPSSAPGFTIVDELSRNIVDYFEGRKTGEEILFSPARLSLWFDYFNNDNLLYAVNNRLGAEAVVRAISRTHGSSVLELGGGAGSAASALLERLEVEGLLGKIEKYVFTEPVPAFLRRGERALRGRFPGVSLEARKLDMNLSLPEQGLAPESFDLVYAVNTIHVAHDLGATLRHVREVLKPGGAAVFSECVRPKAGQPIYVEYAFNFLENFVNVVTDPETRPTHGFLTPRNWRAALAKAGFEKIEILPDVEELAKRFPKFFVAAITSRKPAK